MMAKPQNKALQVRSEEDCLCISWAERTYKWIIADRQMAQLVKR